MHRPRRGRTRAVAWLEDRYELGAITHFIDQQAGAGASLRSLYYLGGMTLFLFLVQVATGILLLLYYRPSAGEPTKASSSSSPTWSSDG